jgi:hypothetical protein
LIIRVSDLPPGFSVVPGESLRTPLAWVLADPWSAGYRDLIRRERVAGYQSSFWTPQRHRLECEVAVYRSAAGARRVYALRMRRIAVVASDRDLGAPVPTARIGAATRMFRMEGPWNGYLVAWRHRNLLADCTEDGLDARSSLQVRSAAVAQQRRLSGQG